MTKQSLPWVSMGLGLLVALGLAPACGSEEMEGQLPASGGTGGSGGAQAVAGLGGVGGLGIGGTGGQPNNRGMLGARCARDSDCGDGLTCITSDSGAMLGGGPAGGLCTAVCTGNPQACQPFGGGCVRFGNESYCLEPCTFGDGQPTKCHGRDEMACSFFQENVAFCLPQCNGVAGECRAGMFCDFGEAAIGVGGYCRAQEPTGLRTGAPCNPRADVDPCRGICVPMDASGSVGMCQDGCTVGVVESCVLPGFQGNDAFCLPGISGGRVGDAGLCTKLCDCSEDCGQPAISCIAIATVEQVLGRKGLCAVAQAGDVVVSCPGGAGGAGGASGGASGASGGAGGTASGGTGGVAGGAGAG